MPLPDEYLEVCILEADGDEPVPCSDGLPHLENGQRSTSQGASVLFDTPDVHNRTKLPIPLRDQEIVGEEPNLAIPRLHLPYGCFLQKGGEHDPWVCPPKQTMCTGWLSPGN